MAKIKDCVVIDKEALQQTIKILELSKCSVIQTNLDINNVNIVIKTLEEIINNSTPLTPIIQDALNEVSKGLCQTANQWNSDFNGQKLYIKNFKYETEI
jgi:hypothetical protein